MCYTESVGDHDEDVRALQKVVAGGDAVSLCCTRVIDEGGKRQVDLGTIQSRPALQTTARMSIPVPASPYICPFGPTTTSASNSDFSTVLEASACAVQFASWMRRHVLEVDDRASVRSPVSSGNVGAPAIPRHVTRHLRGN
eukprot:Polyplicarium_translucidae@DN3384_c2_g1_i11.p3